MKKKNEKERKLQKNMKHEEKNQNSQKFYFKERDFKTMTNGRYSLYESCIWGGRPILALYLLSFRL